MKVGCVGRSLQTNWYSNTFRMGWNSIWNGSLGRNITYRKMNCGVWLNQ